MQTQLQGGTSPFYSRGKFQCPGLGSLVTLQEAVSLILLIRCDSESAPTTLSIVAQEPWGLHTTEMEWTLSFVSPAFYPHILTRLPGFLCIYKSFYPLFSIIWWFHTILFSSLNFLLFLFFPQDTVKFLWYALDLPLSPPFLSQWNRLDLNPLPQWGNSHNAFRIHFFLSFPLDRKFHNTLKVPGKFKLIIV